MKRSSTVAAAVILALFTPMLAYAQQSGDPLQTTAQKVITWITGPMGILIVTLGIIIGALMVIFGRTHEGWGHLGKVVIGGAILIGAVQVVHLFIQ